MSTRRVEDGISWNTWRIQSHRLAQLPARSRRRSPTRNGCHGRSSSAECSIVGCSHATTRKEDTSSMCSRAATILRSIKLAFIDWMMVSPMYVYVAQIFTCSLTNVFDRSNAGTHSVTLFQDHTNAGVRMQRRSACVPWSLETPCLRARIWTAETVDATAGRRCKGSNHTLIHLDTAASAPRPVCEVFGDLSTKVEPVQALSQKARAVKAPL